MSFIFKIRIDFENENQIAILNCVWGWDVSRETIFGKQFGVGMNVNGMGGC